MREVHGVLALAVLVVSCAGASTHAREGDEAAGAPREPTPSARSSAGRRPPTFDIVDSALLASGLTGEAALRRARGRFETLAAPIVERVRAVPDARGRGRLLLAVLHQHDGPFGEYDARATTLQELLDRRRYNCVSASVFYNLLAERVGLEVSAQLLPTHARTMLVVPGERAPIVVETTSRDGFDPDPRVQANILAQVAGASPEARPLVPEAGSNVPTRVLIGTIYVNRASIAQESGDLVGAERLFAEGEALAGSPDMVRVLRDQRAALLSQLGANDLLAEDPARVDRAYRSIESALALAPSQPEIRAAALQNLRAAAERKVHRLASARDEAGVVQVVEQAARLGLDADDRSGLKAFALSEVARVRLASQDIEGAVEILERAVREQLSPRDARLQAALRQNHRSALRMAAAAAAGEGRLDRGQQIFARLESLPGLSAAEREAIAEDQLHILHTVGAKRVEAGDLAGALEVYREGTRRFPRDPGFRQNVVAVLERLVVPLVRRGDCARVTAYAEEIAALVPDSPFARNARLRCLLERAEARLAAQDPAEAVTLLRAARELGPNERGVAERLGVGLLEWARSSARAGSCPRALALVRELKTLALSAITAADIRQALGACRG